MDAEVVEPVLVCIAIAERDQTVEVGHGPCGMATVDQLPGGDDEENAFPRKRKNEGRRENMMSILQEKG